MKMVLSNTFPFKAIALAKGVRGLSGSGSSPFLPLFSPLPFPFRPLFFPLPFPSPFCGSLPPVLVGLVPPAPCPATPPAKSWIVGLAAEKSHPSSVRLNASVVVTPVFELICWMSCLVWLSSLLVSELMMYCLRSSRPGKFGSSMNCPLAVFLLMRSSMSCGLSL